ncbi:MAG TPA: ABC transporter ATP-binding protein [Thermoanaerobaculia bacterium]|nr:ABC transporter ATP-binding protein [Thermoanaerobaculia bacterium]
MTPILAIRGLTWQPDRRPVLGPVDLDVLRGECLAVVGPNGAGKTSLLRCLTGLLRPTAGELRYEGRSFATLSRRELARRIAYVPQIRPASVPLSVEEIVLLGRYPHLSPFQLAPRKEDFAAVDAALALVGIDDLRRRPVDELSGGERQAAFIAAALAQESELLVLDEPTIHLDARHQRDLAELLLRLLRVETEAGRRTVVLASHDLNLASLLGDRLLALSAGQVLACGTPAQILEPRLLEKLFRTRFEIVRGGERPVTLLQLGP